MLNRIRNDQKNVLYVFLKTYLKYIDKDGLDYQNISVHKNMNMREESCKKDIPFRISIENVPFHKEIYKLH